MNHILKLHLKIYQDGVDLTFRKINYSIDKEYFFKWLEKKKKKIIKNPKLVKFGIFLYMEAQLQLVFF